jgi:gluconokinase
MSDFTISPPLSSVIILIMGVAGSGKTTIGRLLAQQLQWPYFEADDFHPAVNKEKMGRGIPLDDDDRAPWLAAIRQAIDECVAKDRSAVFSCSALKQKYRRQLADGRAEIRLVFLTGSRELLRARLDGRAAHYMKPGMLDSQLAILEPPVDAITLDVGQPPEELVSRIRRQLAV